MAERPQADRVVPSVGPAASLDRQAGEAVPAAPMAARRAAHFRPVAAGVVGAEVFRHYR